MWRTRREVSVLPVLQLLTNECQILGDWSFLNLKRCPSNTLYSQIPTFKFMPCFLGSCRFNNEAFKFRMENFAQKLAEILLEML